jgi:NADH dehydrogenase
MSYQNILVLGGTGFVGQSVVERLTAEGRRVCVPTRRRASGRELLVLPTVEVVEADIHDAATLRRLLAGRDAVINLVGVLHDTGRPTAASGGRYGPGFAAAHVELARMLAAACRELGVPRLLHVSALGADPAGPSAYLRSKGDGEAALRAATGVAVTIFRPSVVFGNGDRFLRLFAGLAALLPVLFIGGAQSRLQPVWVQDLAAAIVHALDAPATVGRTYEICGPTVYTLGELVAFAARAGGHPRPVIGLPAHLARCMAAVFEWLPGPTLLSRDNLRSLSVDSIASVQPYVAAPELGIQPSPLEPEATVYLSGLHPRTRFSGFRARAGR